MKAVVQMQLCYEAPFLDTDYAFMHAQWPLVHSCLIDDHCECACQLVFYTGLADTPAIYATSTARAFVVHLK